MVKLQYLYNESCGLRAQLRPLSCKHSHCGNQATSQAKNNFFMKSKFASNLSLCLHPPQCPHLSLKRLMPFLSSLLSDPGKPGVRSLTDVTLADEDTYSILTDNANREIQGNMATQVTQPGGQLCKQCSAT